MKLFANNFCLEFEARDEDAGYRYQTLPAEEVRKKLLLADLPFDNKVFHSPGEGSEETVWLTLTAMSETDTCATWLLVFETDKAKRGYVEAMKKRFKTMAAAGGVVLNPAGEVLMMLRRGRWDLPKGKVESGESYPDAAWREVMEETGIKFHTVISSLPESQHVFLNREKWVWKTTYWFLMQTTEPEALLPQTEEDIEQLEWVPLDALRKKMPEDTFPLIADVLRCVFVTV